MAPACNILGVFGILDGVIVNAFAVYLIISASCIPLMSLVSSMSLVDLMSADVIDVFDDSDASDKFDAVDMMLTSLMPSILIPWYLSCL